MKIQEAMIPRELGLRVGDIVEVRSAEEIHSTLDLNGELDNLPFMPELLQFCGQRFTVAKVAHKVCDTIGMTGMARMRNAVHLEGVRCDGSAHDGCQAACFVYWKEAWLKRVDEPRHAETNSDRGEAPAYVREALTAAARKGTDPEDGREIHSCQATELRRAAPEQLPARDLRQYVWDVRSGNVDAPTALRSMAIALYDRFQAYSRRLLPEKLRIRGGKRFREIEGKRSKTPAERTDLQPGERVRIKSKDEIVATLDTNNLNRGLSFDREMVKYCGSQATVLRRVSRIVDEKTGKMLEFKNPCITLDGVICPGDYNQNCPRAFHVYWREIWLEREDEEPA